MFILIGERYTKEMFVPIGNYILLQEGESSILDSAHVTPQVQELVLNEPIRKVESIQDIQNGHSISSYCKTLTFPNRIDQKRSDVQSTSEFLPSLEQKASIVWTKNYNGGWRCQLAARGHFLQPLQMTSEVNDFSTLPFNSSSKWTTVSIL